MLAELKRLNCDGVQLDELMAHAAFAKILRAEYEGKNITAPEWLDDAIRRINREITLRSKDALEMRLKEIRAQRTQLMTPTEKREQLEKEEAALQEQLAKA